MVPPSKKPISGVPPKPEEEAPSDEMGPRKLIRPSLANIMREQGAPRPGGTGARRVAPPDQTNAEAYYYLKQMQSKTPIVVRLVDGEELRGWIEWYDKDVIKLNRDYAPNLLIPKRSIKYLFKEEEERLHRKKRRPLPGAGPGVESSGSGSEGNGGGGGDSGNGR
jgi:sRNA-binding regulator protein Hfq